MKMLTKICSYGISLLLYWLGFLIPKKPSLWVFGAWFGQRYADNPRWLFEYVLEHHPHIDSVWITRNRGVWSRLRREGKPVLLAGSLKGIWKCLRARVAVCCQSLREDVCSAVLSPATVRVQLWHGIPLKKIGFDDRIFTHPADRPSWQRWKHWFFPFLNEKYDLIPVPSSELVPIFMSAFRAGKETVVALGSPRYDPLLNASSTTEKLHPDGNLRVLYAPTFRGGIGSEVDLFTPYGFRASDVESFCQKHRIHLYFRLHPVNRPAGEIARRLTSSNWLHFLEIDDIYEVLNQFDALITDYSSLFFDFLLLDRPIIFAPFDLEIYKQKEREFYFPYEAVTPGPVVRSWPAVLQELRKLLVDGEDPYREARLRVRQRFHQWSDNHNCQRVVHAILERL